MQRVDNLAGDPKQTLYRGGSGGQAGPGPWRTSSTVGNENSNILNGQDGRALTLAEIAEASFNCHDAEPLLPNEALQCGCGAAQPQPPTQTTGRGAQPSLARGSLRGPVQVRCFVSVANKTNV